MVAVVVGSVGVDFVVVPADEDSIYIVVGDVIDDVVVVAVNGYRVVDVVADEVAVISASPQYNAARSISRLPNHVSVKLPLA